MASCVKRCTTTKLPCRVSPLGSPAVSECLLLPRFVQSSCLMLLAVSSLPWCVLVAVASLLVLNNNNNKCDVLISFAWSGLVSLSLSLSSLSCTLSSWKFGCTGPSTCSTPRFHNAPVQSSVQPIFLYPLVHIFYGVWSKYFFNSS